MKKWLCSIIVPILIFLLGLSYASSQSSNFPTYRNYRDIPGVTQEDIAALEELLADKPRLVYGLCISAEAYLNDDGSVGGFAAMLCNRLSGLLGFDFDLLPCSWDELNQKIVSKEIDIAVEFTSTPERLEKFLMTDALIRRTLKVFTDANAASLSATAKTRSIKCAFMNGSTTYSLVADSWNIPFEPVFVDDEALIPDLFVKGEIDAFIEVGTLEAAYDDYAFIKAEEYFPLTYSPISLATGNPAFAPFVNVMQKYLENGGYYELAELYSRSMDEYSKHKLYKVLSDEEKAYILRHNQEKTAISVACEADHYPLCFYNTQEKSFQGVAMDILEHVAAITGLRFNVGNEPEASQPELLAGIEEGKYAMIAELLADDERTGRFLRTDEPYCSDPFAMVSRADYPDVDINQISFSKVGLVENSAYAERFREWFPDSTSAATYATSEKAYTALENGEIDLLMGTENFLLHLTNYLEKPRFKTNIVFNYSLESFFGFHQDEEVLRSIVNKAQRYIDTDEILSKWQRKVFDYDSKMLKEQFPYLIAVVLVLLAGLSAVVFLLVKNRQISKSLEKLVAERTDELAIQTSTLEAMFESIPDLVFCKDMNFHFTRCNRSFEEFFGCREADILGKHTARQDGLSREQAKSFHEIDHAVIAERRMIATEEYLPSARGDLRLFETMKTPLMQNGEVVGIMCISRDITTRKAVEETLKLTLDNLDTCIYINEIDSGKILFINERMIKDFGGGEFVGRTCWRVLQDGFTEQCEFCPMPKLLESGDEFYIWEEHNTVTGRYYRNTDSLIEWHDGRMVHMQHSVDITDSVKLQRELEHASKAKSDFLSRMSHEIRTPLNAIIGMNSIAMNTDDLAKMQHCHERVNNASKHLLGLINDILDMSKIEADKFELSISEFDFEKMLMNITNVANFRAEEKHQNLVVNLNRGVPPFIIGDELRLSQVITNLLTNAVKFTPENGTIVLSIEKADEVNGEITLRVEVSDTGIGISEEQQKRLFSSFEQADGSISRKFGGTGLGLAISKRIVELMHGTIWIESELGKGSRFIFTVNVQSGKEKNHKNLAGKLRKENLRILAVDDCAETREYFMHVMAAHHLPCDVAAGGAEALAMVESCKDKPYNIFFVDWQMPEMDGIELAKRIKAVTTDNSVVIMISVADWNSIEQEALAAGVNQFISKPLFPSALIDAINQCIGGESQKATAGAQTTAEENCRSFAGQTIMIAEDIEVNREIMSAVLEESGVSIDFAENGQLAVSMFQAHPDRYSLILMDIHMPLLDGYDATRMIRALALPRAKTIPIIAMSANVFREDVENCLAVGMNDHVGKPVEPDILFAKLDQYMPKKALIGKEAVSEASAHGEGASAAPDYAEFLPEIDVEDGLRRMMNRKNLYFQMLKRFSDMEMANELIKEMIDGDMAKIAGAAHALKGVTSNLGLAEIAGIAANIEAEAKAQAQPEEMLEALTLAVKRAVKAIHVLVEQE